MSESAARGIWLNVRFDMRCPDFGTPAHRLYPEAVRMAEYCDSHGFHTALLSEHHGSEDGYDPSPMVLGAAIASRTTQMRLLFGAMILPLHDPVRMAEDIAVLDNLSGGRVILALVGGYVVSEFRMFGRDLKDRARLVEEGVEVLRKAWTGEPFDYNGRPVLVRPRPVQEHIPIILGGSSKAAARRAGRIADGFMTHLPELHQIYYDEARRLGRSPEPFTPPAPTFVHVTHDPEQVWEQIMPHALHETNAYGAWQEEAGVEGSFRSLPSAEVLRASGDYQVVTPQECIELARRNGRLDMHPLMAGMSPELGWESLELLVAEVLPHLR